MSMAVLKNVALKLNFYDFGPGKSDDVKLFRELGKVAGQYEKKIIREKRRDSIVYTYPSAHIREESIHPSHLKRHFSKLIGRIIRIYRSYFAGIDEQI